MRLVFATTQTVYGSTVRGRIMPLATELAKQHEVHILVHKSQDTISCPGVNIHVIGNDPFVRTEHGKARYKGIRLIGNMVVSSIRTTVALLKLNPDVVVIVKPLPANVLGVLRYRILAPWRSTKVVLDADDFELTANKLSSLLQRAAVHWSERVAARLSQQIITATPFLQDHFKQLKQQNETVYLIPTGLSLSPAYEQLTYQTQTKPVIAYVGSVSAGSGHRVDLLPDILEQVKKEVPNVCLKMIGSGDDVNALREEFEKRNLSGSVEWTGSFTMTLAKDELVSSRSLAALLGDVRLLIDPIDSSITQRAKSSFRVMLATALGWPVIAANVGIRGSIIPQKLHDRLFAQPEDTEDYARKAIGILQQPLTAEEQLYLKEAAKKFTWEELAKEYSRII